MLAVVEAGMIDYRDLLDGTVDLFDVALCSDFLAARADNEDLIRRSKEKE